MERHYYWGLVCVALAGCGSLPFTTQTPGEHFRAYMSMLEANCKKHAASRSAGDASCDILQLKPRDWSQTTMVSVEGQPLPVPEDWISTEVGRLAHSIKVPDPLPADSGYRQGMTSEEYFNLLCEKEAGQFIYKTVDRVDGIYQMRPMKKYTDNELTHLYAIEAPYDYMMEVTPKEPAYEFTLVIREHYLFFESPRLNGEIDKSDLKYRHPSYALQPPVGATVARYSEYNGRDMKSLRKEIDTQRKARYGYTWRGIRREHDTELGIAGGELIVMDLDTNEVLAVRRNYTRSGFGGVTTGIWWMTAPSCLKVTYINPFGKRREKLPNNEFIFSVLKPLPASQERNTVRPLSKN